MGLFIIQTVYHVLSIILLHNATMKYKIIYFVLVTDYAFRNHGVKRMEEFLIANQTYRSYCWMNDEMTFVIDEQWNGYIRADKDVLIRQDPCWGGEE